MKLSALWQHAAQALNEERFDHAFALLERAYHGASHADQTQIALWVASLHSLYGEDGAEDGLQALDFARSHDVLVAHRPLYQAVHAFLRSYLPPLAEQNDAQVQHDKLLAQAHKASLDPDPLVAFIASAACLNLGDATRALPALLKVDADKLAPFLRWRYFSWCAAAAEALEQPQESEQYYALSAAAAPQSQKAGLWQEQAALNLNIGETPKAQALLDQAWQLYDQQGLPDHALLVQWYYLSAQTAQALENFDKALEFITEAETLEEQMGELSYGVQLIHGQIFMSLQQPEDAIPCFLEAIKMAAESDLPYALHELGVAYLDADLPIEARDIFNQVLTHSSYPFLAEGIAELAESEYRLGRLPEAEKAAQLALAQGATLPAHMMLAAIAMDYYYLDDALEHYRQAQLLAPAQSRDWAMAHQMQADILAQQGFQAPAVILEHAQAALPHIDPRDDWHDTLQNYIQKAQKLLSSPNNRLLN